MRRRSRHRRSFAARCPASIEALEPRLLLSWPSAPLASALDILVNQFGDATVSGQALPVAGAHANYAVSFAQAGDAVFQTSGSTDMDVAFYPSAGQPGVTDDRSGEDGNAMILRLVTAGTSLYLSVGGHNDTVTGNFGLHIDGPSATAQTISLDDSHYGYVVDEVISAAVPCQFYEFTPDANGTWEIVVSPVGSLDPTMVIFDADGNPVAGDFTNPVDDNNAGQEEIWTGPLVAGATYFLRVDGYGNTTGRFDVDITGTPSPDTTPPQVQGVTDSADGSVVIGFDEPMRTRSLDAGFDLWVQNAAGQAIAGTSVWLDDSDLQWTPTATPPQSGDTWTIYLSGGGSAGVADLAGNPLDGDGNGLGDPYIHSWAVASTDVTPPQVAAYHLGLDGTVTIDFTEPILPQTVADGLELLVTGSGGVGDPIQGSMDWFNGNTRLVWRPDAPPPGTSSNWTLTLNAQASSDFTDRAGNSFDGDVDGQAGGAWARTWAVQTTDSTPPAVLSVHGARDGTLVVDFSEPVQAGDPAAAFHVLDALGHAVDGAMEWSYNSTRLTWTPTQLPAGNQSWTATLLAQDGTGMADRAGNLLDGDGNGLAGGNRTYGWTVGVSDTTPPAVQSIDTRDDGRVLVRFSETILAAGVAYGTDVCVRGLGGRLVPGTIQWDASHTAFTWTPSHSPPGDVSWTITLSGRTGGGLVDRSANRLDGDGNGTPGGDYSHTWSVTGAGDVTPPAVISFHTDWQGQVIIDFSEPILAANVLNGTGLFVRDGAGNVIVGTVQWNANATSVTWTPDLTAAAADLWTITLKSDEAGGFVDANWNVLDGDSDGVQGGDYVGTWEVGPPAAPRIGSLSAGATLISPGATIALTANGVTGDPAVQAVEFYRDVDGNATVTAPDVLLGTDTDGGDGWAMDAASTGMAPGVYQFLARAFDGDLYSNVVSTSLRVNALPTITGLSAATDLLRLGDSVLLTAGGAADDVGVTAVRFYRDTNENGTVDVDDVLVATDSNAADGWSASVSTAGLAAGSYQYVAQASDALGDGQTATHSVTVLQPLYSNASRRLTWGNVTLTLSVAGSFVAYPSLDGSELSYIDVTGTTSKCTFSITSRSAVRVGDITVSGALAAINAPMMSLAGSVTVAGVLKTFKAAGVLSTGAGHLLRVGPAETARDKLALTFTGSVWDLSINSGTPISTLSAGEWLDSGPGNTIHAPSIATIAIKGGFAASLQVSSLGSAAIRGQIGQGTWTIAGGTVKSITAPSIASGWTLAAEASEVTKLAVTGTFSGHVRALRIKTLTAGLLSGATVVLGQGVDPRVAALGTLTAKGGIVGSTIRATGNIGTINALSIVDSLVYAGLNEAQTGLPTAGDFAIAGPAAAASIAKLTMAKGGQFARSVVAAASLGAITLRGVTSDGGDSPFGLVGKTLLPKRTYVRYAGAVLAAKVAKAPAGASELDRDGQFVFRLV